MEPTQPTDRASDALTFDDHTATGAEAAGVAGTAEVPTSGDRQVPVEQPTPTAELRPVADPEPEEDGVAVERARSERSPKDMAISLLVLLVPIALVLGFYRIFLGGDDAPVVDPAPAVAQARAAGAFPISEPAKLAPGWRTVRASFQRADDGATLRIGYLSPEGGGVQLVQSSLPADQLLPTELTDRGRPQGPTELAGRSWQRYTARIGENALVLLEPERTVIVVGSVPENDLRALAHALG